MPNRKKRDKEKYRDTKKSEIGTERQREMNSNSAKRESKKKGRRRKNYLKIDG